MRNRADMLSVIQISLLIAIVVGSTANCADRATTCDKELNAEAQQLELIAERAALGSSQSKSVQEQMARTLRRCRDVIAMTAGYSVNDPFPHARNALTALDLAAMANDAELVRWYLDKGVSVLGIPGQESSHVYSTGGSTLHVAATYGSHLAMSELLKETTNASPQDKLGTTPLMRVPAYFDGGRQTMALLLGEHIDLEATDQKGRSALTLAVMRGDVEKVRILVKAGANVDVLLDGITLQEYASQHGQHEMAELLKRQT